MGKAIWWILGLFGAGVIVYKVAPVLVDKLRSMGSGKSAPMLPAASRTVLVPCAPGGSPAPGGVAPMSGVQSHPTFQWCYIVREGDTSGGIAKRITGQDSRYTELLIANPTIPQKGVSGTFAGPKAWDFADGSLSEGTKVIVPITMNGWIDQTGTAKGSEIAYPMDTRAVVISAGEEVHDSAMMAPESNGASFSEGFDYEGAGA